VCVYEVAGLVSGQTGQWWDWSSVVGLFSGRTGQGRTGQWSDWSVDGLVSGRTGQGPDWSVVRLISVSVCVYEVPGLVSTSGDRCV